MNVSRFLSGNKKLFITLHAREFGNFMHQILVVENSLG
jgi:hypothetical protein